MADKIDTLHPKDNLDDNIYPNIKADNIPDAAITKAKLSSDITLIDEVNPSEESSANLEKLKINDIVYGVTGTIPSNMVTTDTDQEISGTKTFTNIISANAKIYTTSAGAGITFQNQYYTTNITLFGYNLVLGNDVDTSVVAWNIIPYTNGSGSLGNTSYYWQNLYLTNSISFKNDLTTFTIAPDSYSLKITTGQLVSTGKITPPYGNPNNIDLGSDDSLWHTLYANNLSDGTTTKLMSRVLKENYMILTTHLSLGTAYNFTDDEKNQIRALVARFGCATLQLTIDNPTTSFSVATIVITLYPIQLVATTDMREETNYYMGGILEWANVKTFKAYVQNNVQFITIY